MKKTPWGHIENDNKRVYNRAKETLIVGTNNPNFFSREQLLECYNNSKNLKKEFNTFEDYYVYYKDIKGLE